MTLGRETRVRRGPFFSVSHRIKHHLPLAGVGEFLCCFAFDGLEVFRIFGPSWAFSGIQERTDSIHLLVSIICQRKEEWTGQILALTCNAVAHFHIYRPRFWRQASMSLMRLSDDGGIEIGSVGQWVET